MDELIRQRIAESIETKERMLADEVFLRHLMATVELCVKTFKNKRKILLCGNGGSAADAQHIAAELSGRFYKNRPPLYAEALHVNTSYLTAVANDYGYDEVFARLIEGQGNDGDLLLVLSTSGNSENIVRAAKTAQNSGLIVVGLTGAGGGRVKEYCTLTLEVPSRDTPRIQECHILIGHIICELVEAAMFP